MRITRGPAIIMASQLQEVEELCQFLTPSTRLDLKSTALEYVLGLTGFTEGVKLFRTHTKVLQQLLELTADTSQPEVSKNAYLVVLNASTDAEVADSLIELRVIPRLLELVADPEWSEADKVCLTSLAASLAQ